MRECCKRWLTVGLCLWALGNVSLPPVAAEETNDLDQRIVKLIEQLGDKEYAVRKRAQRDLARIGNPAFDALTAAEENDDLEIAFQARYLVRQIRNDWIADHLDTAPPQIKTILKDKDFDQQSDANRLSLMKRLAELPGDAGVEWLCQIVRFEQSPVVSKQGALLLIAQESQPDAATLAHRATIIEKALERSSRPASRWLKIYAQMPADPQAALGQWSKLLAAERQTLMDHPQESNPDIVIKLLRVQASQYQALGRDDDALRSMHEMVALERGDPVTLGDLVGWLAKRHAWTIIDEVAKRFASSFDADPQLLYTLAQAYLAEGKAAEAEQAAQKALRLNPDRAPEHVQLAMQLQSKGLMDWADREYRHVIGMDGVGPEYTLLSRWKLAENLHDRQQDGEATRILEEALPTIDKHRAALNRFNATPDAWRAQAAYFGACYEFQLKNYVKQRERLEKALEIDPTNADVLIALFHIPDQTPEQHAKAVELIKNAVQTSRNQIDEEPDSPTHYNQFAWLVGNTEGDFDEAIRMSQKSVKMLRDQIADLETRGANEAVIRQWQEILGGLLDTLAHCYAGKGDFENAALTQTEANRLHPHSQQISRKLDFFRQKAKEQKAKKNPSPSDEPDTKSPEGPPAASAPLTPIHPNTYAVAKI